eukprot:2152978-Rhodomonas_salina.1
MAKSCKFLSFCWEDVRPDSATFVTSFDGCRTIAMSSGHDNTPNVMYVPLVPEGGLVLKSRRSRMAAGESSSSSHAQHLVPSAKPGRVVQALVQYVQDSGGELEASRISELYLRHPWTKEPMQQAGLKKFCEMHSGQVNFVIDGNVQRVVLVDAHHQQGHHDMKPSDKEEQAVAPQQCGSGVPTGDEKSSEAQTRKRERTASIEMSTSGTSGEEAKRSRGSVRVEQEEEREKGGVQSCHSTEGSQSAEQADAAARSEEERARQRGEERSERD